MFQTLLAIAVIAFILYGVFVNSPLLRYTLSKIKDPVIRQTLARVFSRGMGHAPLDSEWEIVEDTPPARVTSDNAKPSQPIDFTPLLNWGLAAGLVIVAILGVAALLVTLLVLRR